MILRWFTVCTETVLLRKWLTAIGVEAQCHILSEFDLKLSVDPRQLTTSVGHLFVHKLMDKQFSYNTKSERKKFSISKAKGIATPFMVYVGNVKLGQFFCRIEV